MLKKYFYIILFLISFTTTTVVGQESKSSQKSIETSIEGLSFYPNPVTNGKVYISSKLNADKQIAIFDVLGKKVLQTLLSSK